jgi:hypothetical protein
MVRGDVVLKVLFPCSLCGMLVGEGNGGWGVGDGDSVV